MKRNPSAIIGLSLLALSQTANAGTAHIAANGGDYITVSDAMTDITTWCGTASVTNPCVLDLEPGRYVVPNGDFTLPDFVSMNGSGKRSSVIYATGSDRVISTGEQSTISNLGVDLGSNHRLIKIGISADGEGSTIRNVRISSDLLPGRTVKGISTRNIPAETIVLNDVEVDLTVNNGYVTGVAVSRGRYIIRNINIHIRGGEFSTGFYSNGPKSVSNVDVLLEDTKKKAIGFHARSHLGYEIISPQGFQINREGLYSEINSRVLTQSTATESTAVFIDSARSGLVHMHDVFGRALGGGDKIGLLVDNVYLNLHLTNSTFMGETASIRIPPASNASTALISGVTGFYGPVQISNPVAKCSHITDESGVAFANTCPNQ